jgi:alpha-beta hydrolase superfamily lysophospholipase
MAVQQTAEGWTITGSGQLGPPVDMLTNTLRVRYDENWKPLGVNVDGSVRGVATFLRTTVTGTTARSDASAGDAPEAKVDTIDPSAVLLLPGPFIAPYEAVAFRLKTAAPGTAVPAYVSSQVPIMLRVGESASEQIQTLARLINARRTRITFEVPGMPPSDADVWADENGRLLRLTVPDQGLDAVRADIASVSTRRVTVSRPGDTQVTIPANGFSLAGTISKPAAAAATPLPAVVLVGGSGLADRDETIAGIPIIGQLAGALADAGFVVLRYDKRGIGQSGGRAESATVSDYAEDVRAAVRFMASRRDVDRRRLAVAGYADGGTVAMLAASRENRIGALVLIATAGMSGADLNLSQVERAQSRSARSESEKQATVELQKKIQTAVMTGKGWEEVPPNMRRQADVPWFQSFLAFDPVRVMRDVDQPVLVLQPALDTQVAPVNAERLETAAKARRKVVPVEVITLAGLNHLLVPATTGEADEYGALRDKNVGADVSASIAGWLGKTLTARR